MKITLYDVRNMSVSNAEDHARFDHFPIVQALVARKRIKLLGNIVRDKIISTSCLILIALALNIRATDQP